VIEGTRRKLDRPTSRILSLSAKRVAAGGTAALALATGCRAPL